MRFVVVAFVLAVVSCGGASRPVRMASYKVPRAQLDAAVTDVIHELGYPADPPATEATHTDFRVGPLYFDANKHRSPGTKETAPVGSYEVTLFIGAVMRDGEGYLDIRPVVFRREQTEWKIQGRVAGGMTSNGRHDDPFQYDTWLASIADPIFEGVHARLTPP